MESPLGTEIGQRPTPDCTPLRPSPYCYGCVGTGEFRWHTVRLGLRCFCTLVCENHADQDSVPCAELENAHQGA